MVVAMRVFPLVMVLVLAQPASATQMVQLTGASQPNRLAECPTDDPACISPANAPAATGTTGVANGPIIAGLLGLLVLGMVFGRRKGGLPEVVS